MKLYPDCDYFNEKQDDPSAPPTGNCEDCYRWETCSSCKGREEEDAHE